MSFDEEGQKGSDRGIVTSFFGASNSYPSCIYPKGDLIALIEAQGLANGFGNSGLSLGRNGADFFENVLLLSP